MEQPMRDKQARDKQAGRSNARFVPPPVPAVRMGGFWGERIETVRSVTAPILRRRCDEACNENLVASVRRDGWAAWSDSWQWTAFWVLPAIALVVSFVLLARLLVRGREPRAWTVLLFVWLSFGWITLWATA